MNYDAIQRGLFETTGPHDEDPNFYLVVPPALRCQLIGGLFSSLDRNRQAIVLAELASGKTTARSLNARVALLARQQAQGAADGDQMQWGR